MYHTLFPEYINFEKGRSEQETHCILKTLRCVGLEVLATNSERRHVIKRLAERKILTAQALMRLQREEVKEWKGVGEVFLNVLDEMREEVFRQPEKVAQTWHNEHAALVFPLHDAEETDELSLFGDDYPSSIAVVAEKQPRTLEKSIVSLEAAFLSLLQVLPHRWKSGGEVVQRFFLNQLSAETIAKGIQLKTRATIHRIIDQQFLQPLHAGKPLYGLQLSERCRNDMKTLAEVLVFQPVNLLSVLERLAPERFLKILGLKILRRTSAEQSWACDFIVRENEVQQSRKTLQQAIFHLQFQPDYISLPRLQQKLRSADGDLLSLLLHKHPWIEESERGFRLRSEQLSYDFCRAARILLDQGKAMHKSDIIIAFEHRYLERPNNLSLKCIRRHFPSIYAIKRSVWKWEASEDAESLKE